MKQILRTLWRYKLPALALLAVGTGAIFDVTEHKEPAHWVLGIVLLVSIAPLARITWTNFRHGQYDLYILPIISLALCVVTGQYWAGIALLGVLLLTRHLTNRAGARLAKTNPIFSHVPSSVSVMRGTKQTKVALSHVQAGDKVVVTQDGIVPVDGTILSGTATVDCHAFTGDVTPRSCEPGEFVAAGSINRGNEFVIRAVCSAQESQITKLEKLLRSAKNSQSPLGRRAEQLSLFYTAAVLIGAIVARILSGDLVRMLDVILPSTVVPFIVVMPLIYGGALYRMNKWGVYIRSTAAFERLAKLKTMMFSKTGTVTTASPVVTSIITFHGFKQADVLSAAAALEQNSEHPFALAILAAAKAKKITPPKAKHVHNVNGHGLSAQLKGKSVLVGRLDLLWDNDVTLPPTFKSSSISGPAACVAIDGALAGIVLFDDPLRGDAKRTIQGLSSHGLSIMLVTGDNLPAARQAAKGLGLKNYNANALPLHKLQLLEGVSQRPVAYVGNSKTDKALLSAAEVGISFHSYGAAIVSDAADIIIPGDDLVNIYKATRFATRTVRLATRIGVLGILASIVAIGIFATGAAHPIIGVIVQGILATGTILLTNRIQRLKA